MWLQRFNSNNTKLQEHFCAQKPPEKLCLPKSSASGQSVHLLWEIQCLCFTLLTGQYVILLMRKTRQKSWFYVLVFFGTLKCSVSFMWLQLYYWSHMECFDNICGFFFWTLTVSNRFCIWTIREHLDYIKNILICLAKMNEGLGGLKLHEGE